MKYMKLWLEGDLIGMSHFVPIQVIIDQEGRALSSLNEPGMPTIHVKHKYKYKQQIQIQKNTNSNPNTDTNTCDMRNIQWLLIGYSDKFRSLCPKYNQRASEERHSNNDTFLFLIYVYISFYDDI